MFAVLKSPTRSTLVGVDVDVDVDVDSIGSGQNLQTPTRELCAFIDWISSVQEGAKLTIRSDFAATVPTAGWLTFCCACSAF